MAITCSREVVQSHYWGHKDAQARPWFWVLAHSRRQRSKDRGSERLVGEASDVRESQGSKGKCEVQAVAPEVAPCAPLLDTIAQEATNSSADSQPHAYRLRGAGIRAFDMEAQPSETVSAFRARLEATLQPGGAPGATQMQLSHRDPLHGGMVELGSATQQVLICKLVPDRSAITVKLACESFQRAPAVPRSADQVQVLRALHAEGKMLHWERTRLARELRGLHVLLETISGHAPREKEALPTDDDTSWDDADERSASARNEALRVENRRLIHELAGMEVLVHRLSTKGKESAGQRGTRNTHRAWRGEVAQGVVHQMPPDGSCLFHSLAHGLGSTSADRLRQDICDFIELNPDATMSGNALQNWVLWESGQLPKQYAVGMRAADAWGGPIEMAVCSLIMRVHVHVYLEVGGSGYQRICTFDESGNLATGVVSVLFSPGHYDAFEVQQA